MLANLRQRLSGQYWLGVIPGLLVLIYRDFIPKYLTDDPVRVVSIRRSFDQAFLSHEWLQLAGYDEDRLTILFKFLFAPLWLWLKSPIPVALCGRIVVWTLVLYAIVRLARALNVPRYALAIGLFYWIDQGQSLGAGEWIFGGAEGKCLAYVAIMLALEALLRGKRTLAAAFCGLAFYCHVPVGLWGVLAVYGAILFSKHEHGFIEDVLKPVLITFVTSLPMAWIAWKYAGVAAPAGGIPSTDWLIVIFRNPHHLDPRHFGGVHMLLKLLVCAALALLGLKTMVTSSMRRALGAFMAILMLEVTFGLIAREFNFFLYLKTYPFRVADVLIYFLCCLILPKLIVDIVSGATAFRYFPAADLTRKVAFAALAVGAFTASTFSLGLAKSDKFFVRQFVTSWSSYLRHDTTPYQEMTRWIRSNTPATAVMIIPPWLDDFPLEAERAPMVDFRRNPHNGLIQEWYHRYMAVNGGDFHSLGLDTVTEVQGNYGKLSLAQLENIRRMYGGEYYLTQTRREDLATQLIHSNGDYYLYTVPSD